MSIDEAPLVELTQARRCFGSLTAVEGLTVSVRRGEMFGLIGPDGAGKTTTLRMVCGLLRPTSGGVRTCGLDPYADNRDLSRKIGYLSQRFSLYGDLTVDENVAFFAAIHGVHDWKRRREELLERVRLAPFRPRLADRLSGGMRQKLALAASLIHVPELLVLDEPSTGVDPVSRREFWRILAELVKEGLTVLLTTPYLDEAERCHRVALMHRGALLALDEPDAVRRSLAGLTVEVVARPRHAALARLRARPEAADVETFGERLHVRLPHVAPPALEMLSALRLDLESAGITVETLAAVPPSLEDVFISRVREREGTAEAHP